MQTTINQETDTGGRIRDNNMNPGDIPLTALYVLHRGDRSQLHLNFGLSIPVGMLLTLDQPITPTSPNFSIRSGQVPARSICCPA